MNNRTNGFVDPNGKNIEQAEKIFFEATDLLLNHLASAGKKRVIPPVSALNKVEFSIPQKPYSDRRLRSELAKVLKLSMNPSNPSYIGHMDSIPTMYSIIGSLYSSAINNNMFSVDMSPYLTRMEYFLTNYFAQRFGFGKKSGGMIVSGGTLSNIQAIITARNWSLNDRTGNISDSKTKLVFFASKNAHVSLKKAAMISGMGLASLIEIESEKNGRLSITDLVGKIQLAKSRGLKPFAVVATAGTTVTGSIDPIVEIGKICKREKLWFHVDAIYGGAVILSKQLRHRLSGISQADSISFNPQKWMHVSKTCSLLLFKKREVVTTFFSIKATYTKPDNQYLNLSELTIQGTRHADVLKLWLSMLSIGLNGYEQLINHSFDITKKFIKVLSKNERIEFAGTDLNIPTFRIRGKTDEDADKLNLAYNEFATKHFDLFFSLPVHEGRYWQRTILLNPFIDDRVIEMTARSVNEFLKIHSS